MKTMNSVLSETVLLCQAIVFWLVALPTAALVFPAIALWEQIERLATADSVYPALCEG